VVAFMLLEISAQFVVSPIAAATESRILTL
jgi:hypothetical protein